MSRILEKQVESLALCASVPHRGVLGLVRAAMGRSFDNSLPCDLRASDPDELARIAVFNYVHVVLATGFERAPDLADAVPRDLVIFFQEMQAANLRRNAQILNQLCTIGAALAGADLRGVVMKGGAELLAPVFPVPAFRFLSDLDILLPDPHVEPAIEALQRLGAISDPVDEINGRHHHHVAPLRHVDWPVQVELHRAPAQGAAQSILSADQVLQMARPSGLRGISVPAPADRMAHAVLHAQFSPPRYRDGILSLRDILETEFLAQTLSHEEVSSAKARFQTREARAAWAALHASRIVVLGDRGQGEVLPPDARAWAERAIAGFGRPGRRRATSLLRWVGWYAKEALLNSERRAHYVRKLIRPGALSRVFAQHRENWRRIR